MTTGSPATSRLATCGNDPIVLLAPFGGWHGTRLKMSLADLATSFTLSIALPVMPLAAGLTAAVAAAFSTGGFCSFLLAALALSDSAACGATCGGVVWASSGGA